MAIIVSNTLNRNGEKELFQPDGKKVRMFVCGPTVYDFPHLGHARTYISFDVIARYLRSRGYDVFYLQNITDVDDKIIARAQKEKCNPKDLAEKFTEIFLEDMKNLGLTGVSEYVPATNYIPQIVSQIKRLEEKGAAYLIENDGYYFDLSKFPEYGKLSGRKILQAEDAVSRIDENVKKRNKGDFCLWKLAPYRDEVSGSGFSSVGRRIGEPVWETELGPGRPGWHIEDTAITESFFGPQYEIHGGARDLIFPHHEAEIAQMETVSGLKPFVRYWLHTGFLTIKGQRMSKSLGNFISVRDALKKYSSFALRFMMLSSHYRSPIDYNENYLKSAEAAVSRLMEFAEKVKRATLSPALPDTVKNESEKSVFRHSLENHKKAFYAAMDDDFNAPLAIGWLFNFIKEQNTGLAAGLIDQESARLILEFLEKIDKIFGFIPPSGSLPSSEVQTLIELREAARQNKDFAKADQLRQKINDLGYRIDDTIYGPFVKKLK